jgi:hypothetical protein
MPPAAKSPRLTNSLQARRDGLSCQGSEQREAALRGGATLGSIQDGRKWATANL